MNAGSAEGPAGTTFARRLDALLDRWELEHGARLSNRDVQQLLAEAGQPISESYLSQLRRGVRDNPAPSLIAALVAIFDVHRDYFEVGLSPMAAGDRDLVADLRNPGLRRLLRTTDGLPTETLDLLVAIADKLRAADDRQDDSFL